MELSQVEHLVLYRIKHHFHVNLPVLIMTQIHYAIHRSFTRYYPHGLLVSHIMMKWNVLRAPLRAPRLSLGVIGLSMVSKMGFQLEDGILVPKPVEPVPTSEGGAKRPRSSNVDTAGTSRDAENIGTENFEGAETSGHGGDTHLTAWIDEISFNDLPGASGPSQSSIEAQLAEIRQTQIEMKKEQATQRACLSGIVRFLTCWGKKQGASDDDLQHLQFPDPSQEGP
ncbi:hypothetical protein LIER_24779 [Lithospermum erythrorhizon]|uniref:Uncharacterized protein n=1 Tax=Lithospermum erythrorhizon TaxID=34254 RepID=A0AAV3R8A5_LITER